jgi:hypothetical protein
LSYVPAQERIKFHHWLKVVYERVFEYVKLHEVKAIKPLEDDSDSGEDGNGSDDERLKEAARTIQFTPLSAVGSSVGSTVGRGGGSSGTGGVDAEATVARPVQETLFGIYDDGDLQRVLSAAERFKRFVSEGDLSEAATGLKATSYLQLMLARQMDTLPPTSRTFLTPINTTQHWVIPSTGKLHIEPSSPLLCPTAFHVMTNGAFLSLTDPITPKNKLAAGVAEQIFATLTGTKNELFLTCSQAEALLLRLMKFNRMSHYSLVESLVYQVVSAAEAQRFIVRNLYFKQVRIQFSF